MRKSLKAKEKEIWRMMNTGLLACAGLFGAGRFFGIAGMSWMHMLAAGIALFLLLVMDGAAARGRFLCLSATGICLLAAALSRGWEISFRFLKLYGPWLMGSSQIPEEFRFYYELLQVAVIVCICYPIQLLLEKSGRFRIFSACLVLGFLLFCLFSGTDLQKPGVAFLMLFLVTRYVEWTQERWKKIRSGAEHSYLLWIAPFLIVYLLFLAASPAPAKPYEWFWVKNIYRQMKEAFYVWTQDFRWGGGEGFDIAFSGFSEEGDLHSELLLSAREVMSLAGESSLTANVYLTGKIYDAFDGRQWLKEDESMLAGGVLDAMQTLYAVRAYDRDYQRDYLKEVRLEILYEDFRTAFCFAPLKTYRIDRFGTEKDYTWQGGMACFDSYKSFGTSYRVRFYQLNNGMEDFDSFLESGAGNEEEIWRAVLENYGTEDGDITEEKVAAYRQEVYDIYRKKVSLSEEVEKYLQKVTEGAVTEVEKLRAIEQALSSYTYTQAPGALPDQVRDAESFLDFFLLESRQGYCTYFATAFVLLARAEGIPARYVQGYCVPIKGSKEGAVSSDMAHAWPEAYIQGVGWIPFEPTPGYDGLRYSSWGLTRQRKAQEESVSQEEPVLEEEAAPPFLSPWPEKEKETFQMPAFFVLSVLAAVLLLLLADGFFGKRRYAAMSTDGRFLLEAAKTLRLLSWMGVGRTTVETFEELADRSRALGMELEFIEDYERVLYGGAAAEEEMIEKIRNTRRLLLEKQRMESRQAYVRYRIRLFWSRYR